MDPRKLNRATNTHKLTCAIQYSPPIPLEVVEAVVVTSSLRVGSEYALLSLLHTMCHPFWVADITLAAVKVVSTLGVESHPYSRTHENS